MSESRREVLERLRALDRALARRSASAPSRERLRRRLQRRAVEQRFVLRLRWWPAIAFAAGAITMGLYLADDLDRGSRGERTASAPVEPAEPTASEASPAAAEARTVPPEASPVVPCAEPAPGKIVLGTSECASGGGVRASALLESDLQWSLDRVELRSGELLFEVEPRPDRPFHVSIGEVDVEVVGTRFVVHHGALRWVSVLEGHVRVRVGDDPPRDLRRGQRFEWPEPKTDARTRAPRPSRPEAARRTENEGLAELLAEVAELRRNGAYRQAVERLRAGDRRGWSRRARQMVSYEIGTLLERQLGDVAGACAHWSEHQRRYPHSRYARIVDQALERLECAR